MVRINDNMQLMRMDFSTRAHIKKEGLWLLLCWYLFFCLGPCGEGETQLDIAW